MRQAVPPQNKPSFLMLFAKTANVTLFVATVLIAILMLISFYSYHPHDPAWSNATATSDVIHNYAGEQGAYFADIMFSAIGKTAWLLPFLLIGFGYQLFLKRRLLTVSLHTVTIRIIGTLLAIFALSALLDLQSNNGGMMGGFIGTELTNFLSVVFSINHDILVYITKILFAILTLIGFYLITGCGPIAWADYCGWIIFWLIGQIFLSKKYESVTEDTVPLPKSELTDDSIDGPFEQETIDRMLDQSERKAPTFLNKLLPQEETKPAYIELDEEVLQEFDETNATFQKDTASNYTNSDNPIKDPTIQQEILQEDNDLSNIPPIFRNLQKGNDATSETNDEIAEDEHRILDPFNRELDDWDQFIRTPQEELPHEIEPEPTDQQGIPSIFKNLFKTKRGSSTANQHIDPLPNESSPQLNKRIPDSYRTKIHFNSADEKMSDEREITPTSIHSDISQGGETVTLEPSDLQVTIHNLDENREDKAEDQDITSAETPTLVDHSIAPTITIDKMRDNSTLDYTSEDIESVTPTPTSEILQENNNISQLTDHPATESTIESPPLSSGDKGLIFNPQSGMMEPSQIHYPMAGKLPGLELLDNPSITGPNYDPEELEALGTLIEDQFKHFNIEVKVVNAEPGPVITRFELDLAPGVKIAQINNLNKDIARALAVASVRIVDIIPGKPYIGLEIPNKNRQTVYFKEGLYADEYRNSHHPLTILLGKDVSGKQVVANLKDMPHLLIAGTTGSGKSVGINTILLSLLYKARPEDLRLILIDPKMLELSVYDDIPHLLAPVVTDMKESANALRWAVMEMERRYLLMSKLRVRNISNFNDEVKSAIKTGDPLDDPLWNPAHEVSDYAKAPKLEPLPYIVIVIDELADMMMSVGKAVEELIARLTQKARAAGIHLVVATQRPSVDVITGLIKANIPSRIAFQVSSKIDSRTILDQQGAENLLGQGDMLFFPARAQFPIRVHGAFVNDDEVNRVTDFLRLTGAPNYIEDILKEPTEEIPGLSDSAAGYTPSPDEIEDVLYDEAVKIVLEDQRPTISYIQRKLRIGYQRAARLIETMEEQGIVSAPANNGNREILVKYD